MTEKSRSGSHSGCLRPSSENPKPAVARLDSTAIGVKVTERLWLTLSCGKDSRDNEAPKPIGGREKERQTVRAAQPSAVDSDHSAIDGAKSSNDHSIQ